MSYVFFDARRFRPAFLAVLLAAFMSPAGAATRPLAHWRFDELAGFLAQDSAGTNSGQLSATGADFVSGGVSGNALRLAQSQNGFANMGDIFPNTGSPFTLSAWFKLNAGDTSTPTVIVARHRLGNSNGYFVSANMQGNLGAIGYATFYNGETFVPAARSSTVVNDGQWHHVVAVRMADGRSRIYVDGAPAEDERPAQVPLDRGAPFLVGAAWGAAAPIGLFTGWIDDVQVYGMALADEQITRLFQNPGLNLEDLESPLRFVPGAGSFVGSVEVMLASALTGTTIRYTVNGDEPVVSSTRYVTPLVLSQTTTVKARLFIGEFPVSDIRSATYARVPPVVFSPPGGLFTNRVQVEIANALGVGGVRYTLDGSEPTATSSLYHGSLMLNALTTVKARIFVDSFPASEVISAVYTRFYAIDDGVSNEWRERHFGANYATDPRVGASADPDGDGWSNLLEQQADTNPLDQESRPTITAGIRAIPSISWNSIPGQTYRVLRKHRVTDSEWEVALPALVADSATTKFVDEGAPPTAIYRIELVPPL